MDIYETTDKLIARLLEDEYKDRLKKALETKDLVDISIIIHSVATQTYVKGKFEELRKKEQNKQQILRELEKAKVENKIYLKEAKNIVNKNLMNLLM